MCMQFSDAKNGCIRNYANSLEIAAFENLGRHKSESIKFAKTCVCGSMNE